MVPVLTALGFSAGSLALVLFGISIVRRSLKNDGFADMQGKILTRHAPLSSLLFVAVLLIAVIPGIIFTVKAQTVGLVCMAAMSSSNCPSSPPTVTPTFGPTAFNLVMNVQNSASFNGFDISVKADPAVLNATGFDLSADAFTMAGGMLFVASECINGHPLVGNCVASDGPGVAHVALASNVLVTGGHLYNISYRVLTSTATSFSYQTGCTNSSNDSACVTLVNAGTVDPENLQAANFSPLPDFSIMANPNSVSFNAGSSATSTISIASLNGFSGTVMISACCGSGVSASCSPTNVFVASGGTGTSTCTFTAPAASSTSVTITGTSGTSHSVVVTVNVVDFSITSSASSIAISRGSSATATISVTSVNGFSSTVGLSAAVTPMIRRGPAISLNPTSVSVMSGGTSSSILTISTTHQTPTGSYTVAVTGTNSSLSHAILITITVTK